MTVIKRIAIARTETEVKSLTEFVVKRAGGELFAYSISRPNKDDQLCDLYHHFENCDPRWRATYNSRKWFMNDPLIEYAKSNTEAIASSKIEPKTQGQVDMLSTAAQHGFCSGIVIPTQSSLGAREWLGILLVGSSLEPAAGENILMANRVELRALAMELMEWWKNYFKRDAIYRFKIQEQDINILRQLKNGKSVLEIAAILDLKANSLYRDIRVLKGKLKALKTQEVVQRAKFYGLLS